MKKSFTFSNKYISRSFFLQWRLKGFRHTASFNTTAKYPIKGFPIAQQLQLNKHWKSISIVNIETSVLRFT